MNISTTSTGSSRKEAHANGAAESAQHAADAAHKAADKASEAADKAEQKREQEVPLSEVQPVLPRGGLWAQTAALGRYMVRTEVHTYAFSVAANVILSLVPFTVLMLTLSRHVFHSSTMEQVVNEMMVNLLPSNQAFVMRNMRVLAHLQKGTQLFSIAMLLISSTGVFMPLEVALNDVWGVKVNRSYLRNQLISIGLAFSVGVLAMASVAMTAGQKTLLTWIFFGHTNNAVFHMLDGGMLRVFSLIASTMLFFLIYWVLPNRKIPARAVLPTAVVIGVLWEAAKYLYVLVLPKLDFASVYGPFQVSVGLMIWAFLSGLLLLAGAHFSATRHAIRVARREERERQQKEALDAAGENDADGRQADAESA